MKKLGNWLFRNPETGRVTIAQLPNLPLWGFIVATLARWILPLSTRPGGIVAAIALGFLGWWSLAETFRGVTPFRRMLGCVVSLLVVTMIVNRLR